MASESAKIKYEEEFILNSRGMKLFTCRWLPDEEEPKALIFICHGYAMECSITMSSTAVRLVNEGYAVYGFDYEGHGKSEGLEGFVNNFDAIVDDCSTHYISICEQKQNKSKMRFLLGESMGGAVALLLHKKNPNFWDGAILAAPMCKIADDMRPSRFTMGILATMSKLIPTWRLIPSPDIVDLAFKLQEVRDEIRANPHCYKGGPRIKTGNELFRVSTELEQTLGEISLPFLVLHGEDDKVTDKSVSKELYDVASSSDKTMKLYPTMWHGLLYGELLENQEIVFKDIFNWLNEKCAYGNGRTEREKKQLNEGGAKTSPEVRPSKINVSCHQGYC